MAAQNWDEIAAHYRQIMDGLQPDTRGWEMRPALEKIHSLIPNLRAGLALHDAVIGTSLSTLFFELPHHGAQVSIFWDEQQQEYVIWFEHAGHIDNYSINTPAEGVVEAVHTFLADLEAGQ